MCVGVRISKVIRYRGNASVLYGDRGLDWANAIDEHPSAGDHRVISTHVALRVYREVGSPAETPSVDVANVNLAPVLHNRTRRQRGMRTVRRSREPGKQRRLATRASRGRHAATYSRCIA